MFTNASFYGKRSEFLSKASAYKIMNFDPSKYFQKMNMNNNDIQTKCTVMYTYKVNTISFFNNGLSGINSYM